MSIFIWKDNQQQGPFSEAEIAHCLEIGTYSQEDLAWTDGQSDWAPLSTVLPTSTRTTDKIQETSDPISDAETNLESSKTFSESFLEKATVAARLTQKQAHRKKLEVVDLKQADYQIGKKAYETNISGNHFIESRLQITELGQKIETLRSTVDDPAVSLTDKAKAAANATARTAKIEALAHQRKAIITDLGTKLRSHSTHDPALQAEIASAQKIVAAISKLDSEIQSLSGQTFKWARRPLRIIVVLLLLLAATLSFSWFKGIYQRWSSEREMLRIETEAKAQTARMASEMADLQRKSAEDRKKKQQEREVQLAQQKFDRQKRELEQQAREEAEKQKRELQQQQEAQERVAREEAEEQKRNAEIEERQRQKKIQDEERAKKEAITKKQEQDQRSAFAADQFSRVTLTPSAALSRMLKQFNSSVELRGKDADTLQTLLQQQDYLKLINNILKTPYTEYPPVHEIEKAIKYLLRMDFSIFLKTNYATKNDENIYLISFPNNDYRLINSSTYWKRHPDGTGYIHEWSPSDGPIIIMTGNYSSVGESIHAFNESAENLCRGLKQKMELGEIDEKSYQERVAEVCNDTYQKVLQWALSR